MYECINAFRDDNNRLHYVLSEITQEMYNQLPAHHKSNYRRKLGSWSQATTDDIAPYYPSSSLTEYDPIKPDTTPQHVFGGFGDGESGGAGATGSWEQEIDDNADYDSSDDSGGGDD